jgi:ATP-binding cassette, subfamily B, bacterial
MIFRRRIPVVLQTRQTDCGAACLAMVLAYHKKPVGLEAALQETGAGSEGATALAIMQAARRFGLDAEGVKLEAEDLVHLPPGSILHWEFKHFVVLERMTRHAARIVDPAHGRRRIGLGHLHQAFTGVAILLAPGEGFAPAKGQSRSVWSYVRQILTHPGLVAQIIVASALIQLLGLGLPILTGLLVDQILPEQDHRRLWVLGAALGALVLFHALAVLLRSHLLLYLRTFVDRRMSLDYMTHLSKLPYAFFQRRSTGDLVVRATSNTYIREILTTATLSSILDTALVTVYLAIIMTINPTIGLLVVGLGLLQGAVFLLSRNQYHNLNAEVLAAQARSHGFLTEMLTGMETLKSTGSEPNALHHWSGLFSTELGAHLRRGRFTANTDTLVDALRTSSPMIVLFAGGFQVLQGHMTLGSMFALQALALSVLAPLSSLLESARQLQLVRSHLDRINDVLQTPPEQEPGRTTLSGPLQGGISLDQVSFRYSPRGPLVVRNLSLQVRAGQFVGIVGSSGSGKSTIGKLLLGLYPPLSGRIAYDGVDMAELDLRSVRSRFGVVPQHPYIFGASIFDNIALTNPNLPLEQAMRAAQLAHIHDEISAMPMAYETILADGGSSLSGGQRQRLALARALSSEPSILLLDEATSALDTITESRIQATLATLNCTRIVIAQRLSTIIHADLILVVEGGQVVEQGTHQQLLALGGHYAALVAAQESNSEGRPA